MRKIIFTFSITCLFGILAFGQINQYYDTPVKILYIPKAHWTEEGLRAAQLQGLVNLRVHFLKDGKIGDIKAVSGLPFGLNESAIEAAQKIKFKPATKDRKPVTVTKIVQYKFSLY